MKYRITSEWTVAPYNRGQIVELAYAYAERPGGCVVRVMRAVDRSDGLVCYYGPRGGRIPAADILERED